MLKAKYKLLGILSVLVLFFAGEVRGQSMFPMDPGRGNLGLDQRPPIGNNPFDNPDDEEEGQGEPADTVKKERKPLESYFFDDSVRVQKNFAWTVDLYRNKIHMSRIDTLLNDFQLDYPFMRHDVGDAMLGNLGAPTIPINYDVRPNFKDFSFAQAMYGYIYTPETAPYYNVKLPYTNFTYLTAGQKRFAEEDFRIIHAANIAPATGFNITYQNLNAKGTYGGTRNISSSDNNQRSNSRALSVAFSHTGKRYSVHAGYVNNNINMRENGGLINENQITGGDVERADAVETRLSAARNVVKSNTYYMVHTYGVPLRRLTEDDFSMSGVPAFYLGYAFQYDRWQRRYTDSYTGAQYNTTIPIESPTNPEETIEQNVTLNFYDNWYLNPNNSRDSIFESKLSNRLFIQLQPWDRDGIVGTVDAGVGMDNHYYHMFRPEDYITGFTGGDRKTSYYVYGSVDGKFRKYFDWGASAHYVPLGYKQHDIELEANARMNLYVRQRPLSLSGRVSFDRKEPSYWEQNYISNHYMWSNSFAKENNFHFEVSLSIPQINAEAKFFNTAVTNKIYYDGNDYMPRQYSGTVNVMGVYARKDFRIGGFHFNNRVLLQWSTDDRVIPVPLASVYLSYFFQFDIVRDVLRMRIGLDGRYNTRYYAYGYDPGVMQFYNQRDRKLGEYPMVDVFITAKWKRMRIFLKLEHASQNLFGTRDYFSVLRYPHNQRIFKYGISWSFYD